MCDIYGNICFEKHMKTTPPEWICDCPMECNTISYSFSIVSSTFDPEELCPNPKSKKAPENFLMKPFYENKFPSPFVRRMMKYKDNITFDDVADCKNNLAYRAEVKFKLVTDTMSVTVLSRRLSFFDKLSAFGIGNKI